MRGGCHRIFTYGIALLSTFDFTPFSERGKDLFQASRQGVDQSFVGDVWVLVAVCVKQLRAQGCQRGEIYGLVGMLDLACIEDVVQNGGKATESVQRGGFNFHVWRLGRAPWHQMPRGHRRIFLVGRFGILDASTKRTVPNRRGETQLLAARTLSARE